MIANYTNNDAPVIGTTKAESPPPALKESFHISQMCKSRNFCIFALFIII